MVGIRAVAGCEPEGEQKRASFVTVRRQKGQPGSIGQSAEPESPREAPSPSAASAEWNKGPHHQSALCALRSAGRRPTVAPAGRRGWPRWLEPCCGRPGVDPARPRVCCVLTASPGCEPTLPRAPLSLCESASATETEAAAAAATSLLLGSASSARPGRRATRPSGSAQYGGGGPGRARAERANAQTRCPAGENSSRILGRES